MIIAHPPCTYLTVTGNRWFDTDRYGKKAEKRWRERVDAAVFFMKIAGAECKRIAIENPVGIMGTAYRKEDQIVQPFQFGDKARKATCLWLKGLKKLVPTNVVEPDIKYYTRKDGRVSSFSMDYGTGYRKDAAKERSKTYFGIAKAMAEQWG